MAKKIKTKKEVKSTRKKKDSKVKVKRKKRRSKKEISYNKARYLNLLVRDGDDIVEVKLPTLQRRFYIDEFGLTEIPTLEDFNKFVETIT